MFAYVTALALDIRSTKFATPNGLSDNNVRQILQDSRGYIWFATFNGLTRYDGYDMVKYMPLDGRLAGREPQVRSLFEDSEGYLWIMGYNDIVCCLNLEKDRFERFLPDKGKEERYRYAKEMPDRSVWLWGESGLRRITHTAEGLKSEKIETRLFGTDNIIRVEADMLGRILVGTGRGLWAWKGNKLHCLDGREYQWINTAAGNTALVATDGCIMRVLPNGSLAEIGRIDGVGSRYDLPGSIAKGNEWYISSSSGGRCVNMTTLKVAPVPSRSDLRRGRPIADNLGDIWVHNETGVLYFINDSANALVPLRVIPEKMMKFIDMERYTVTRDRQGRAWITTGVNGLYVYDPRTKRLDHVDTSSGNTQILPTDNLLCSAIDNQGNIWIGMENAGAAMLQTSQEGVSSILHLSDRKGQARAIRMIKKLPGGQIIMSTRDGNLYELADNLKSVNRIPREAVIYDFAVDSKGNRWEVSKNSGIFLNGKKIDYRRLGLTSGNIFTIHIDTQDRIWIGTFGSGLNVLVPSLGASCFKVKTFLNKNYAQRRVRDIFEDSKGYVWVATNQGAYKFDPRRIFDSGYQGERFGHSENVLGSEEIHCFAEDSYGRIWIGKNNDGISILDFRQHAVSPKITNIGTGNGLSHDNVQAFVKGSDNCIWAATAYGVSSINTKTLAIESFVFQSVPSANVHTANSAVLLDGNRLLLGTISGAYLVDLAKIGHRSPQRNLEVSTFKVNGESLPFITGTDYLCKDNGVYTLRLPHESNSLDFYFTTFDFGWPKQTRFRYKLISVDKAWSSPSMDNHITLKNLSPGKYTLLVEASGPDGTWNNRLECNIVITPPWWATWWAKTVYVLLAIAGACLAFTAINRISTLRSKIKMEKQLTDYKLEFFTNISHEFRTPLTLILLSMEKLHEKLAVLKEENSGLPLNSVTQPLATLEKNARRMSRLIDELLTFRKVEKNKMVLYPEPTEVVSFLKEIFDNFKDEAMSKHLSFDFQSNVDSLTMNVDRGALEKIANNLISNALKYTREGGRVLLSVNDDKENGNLEIKVADNGVGISPEKREQLFSRFMQSTVSRNSTGVGLHLTFGLVGLSHGTIRHSDNPGGGSVFTVDIPTNLPASKSKPFEGTGCLSSSPLFLTAEKEEQETAPAVTDKSKMKRMLIIDDDADMRNFLKSEFSNLFEVLTASDGKSGLDAARNNDIHIIICDVMMPDMSGFEVTRLLKEDFATSHIPVIQLTALSNDSGRIEGITSGADAYVTKPFNLRYLKTRVAKLVELRENLFAKLSASPAMARPQLPMSDKDREFADRLAATAEKQLGNSAFSADDFAAEMALGRTIFFRKVKGVTGFAPKEYLRVMRMKKAAELLLTTDMTITEIAYKVGISDPAYFNKCFKAQFGKAPSVYQKENSPLSGGSSHLDLHPEAEAPSV